MNVELYGGPQDGGRVALGAGKAPPPIIYTQATPNDLEWFAGEHIDGEKRRVPWSVAMFADRQARYFYSKTNKRYEYDAVVRRAKV